MCWATQTKVVCGKSTVNLIRMILLSSLSHRSLALQAECSLCDSCYCSVDSVVLPLSPTICNLSFLEIPRCYSISAEVEVLNA